MTIRRSTIVIIAALALVALLTGCITRPATPTIYYTLDYLGGSEQGNLYQDEAFDVTIYIPDTEVAQAYARPQIVERGLGPQFTYLDDDLWGIEISETIADLISRRVSAYGITRQTRREITRDQPDLEIRSEIDSLEYVRYEETERAVLSLTLTLWNVEEDSELFSTRSDVEREIFGNQVGVFVSETNRILFNELDSFLESVVNYLDTGEIPRASEGAEAGTAETEEVDTEEGTGVLLVPGLSDSSNPPFYTLFGPDGEEIGSYQFGESVVVPSGIYSIRLGSGPEELRISVTGVEIRSRQQTVVEPEWSTMTVDAVDENREQARVRYDIYSATTGRSFGGRITTTQQFASAQTVWVLPSGEYKIVINNRPFTTLRDFVTVNLPAEEAEQLTIVVGTDENGNVTSMLGAGNVTTAAVSEDDSPLSLTTALNASFSLTADNEASPDQFQIINFFDSEVDTDLSYEVGPLRYELENTVAVGFNAVDEAPIRVASDEFRLRNTLLYSLTDTYGFYARADASANLTGTVITSDEAFNYLKRDESGTVDQGTDVEQVRLSPPFFPLTLREGVGLNVNAWQGERFDLGIRGGIGASQTVRWEAYAAAGETTIDSTTYDVFERQATETGIGLELLGFVSALLPFNTSLSTTAELFVPFDARSNLSFQIENVVNVVLVNNVSLYYRYLIRSSETVEGEPSLIHDHGVFIRLNYLLRI